MFLLGSDDAAMQTEFEEALSKCDVLWDHFDYGIAKMLKRITSRNVRVVTQLRPSVTAFYRRISNNSAGRDQRRL